MTIPTSSRMISAMLLTILLSTSLGCESLLAAQSTLLAAQKAASTRLVGVVVGYRFEVKSCALSASRTAICKMTVTSQYQDRRIQFRSVGLQDDTGKSYAASIAFGEDASSGSYGSTLVADTPYTLTLWVDNLDTRATKIRAITIDDFYDSASARHRLQTPLTNPPMLVSSNTPATRPAAAPASTSRAPTAPRTPAIPTTPPKARQTETASTNPWEVVGYWNYDGIDGMQLGYGLVLRNQPGGNFGHTWTHQLDLVKHDNLPARPRFLSPVAINRAERKVCINAPGYPTYAGHIDLPGDQHDGAYTFAECAWD